MTDNQETRSSYIDDETGLFNRDFFELTLEREIIRSERNWDPFILAFIELSGDGFSLKKAGEIIKRTVRNLDFVALYTTNIFAILFMQTTTDLVPIAIERILQSLLQNTERTPVIKTGIGCFPDDGFTQQDIISKARDTMTESDLKNFFKGWKLDETRKNRPFSEGTVLVVDDDEKNVKLLRSKLESLNYHVLTALSGNDALNLIRSSKIDLVLLDILMPGKNGFEVCRQIKSNKQTRVIPVIMVTALDDVESKVKGIEAGADDFLSKPVHMEELIARSKSLVALKKTNNSLISIENVLFSLANAVEAKDKTTQGHIERVSKLAVSMGKKMKLSTEDISALRLGGILHDVGKIGISEEILNKDGPLDTEEWEMMRMHPEIGFRICTPLSQTLGTALEVVRHHHEKLDGSSYPDGLKNDDVSRVARIMAVVDIYDALVMDRPYRKAMPKEKALDILDEEVQAGKLDKEAVAVLKEMVNG